MFLIGKCVVVNDVTPKIVKNEKRYGIVKMLMNYYIVFYLLPFFKRSNPTKNLHRNIIASF